MSHFSVLVIGENVEGQLAPFQENNMGDCPEQYLSFHDQEEEFKKQWEEEGTEMVLLEDGSKVHPWDEKFRVPGSIGLGGGSHTVPEHLQKVTVLHKERFPTLEEFAADWHIHKERDPKTGRFGYWENQNKKWDWWVVGGRYSNRLLLKTGEKCDSALKGEVDFETIRSQRMAQAEKEHDDAMAVFGDSPANTSWDEFREKCQSEGIGMDKIREGYWAQERCVKWKEAQKTNTDLFFTSPDEFSMPRQEYVDAAARRSFTSFAVVKDGKWFERGKMGWWACVSDEKDPETWDSMFQNLLDSISDDTRITIVDCHI